MANDKQKETNNKQTGKNQQEQIINKIKRNWQTRNKTKPKNLKTIIIDNKGYYDYRKM